MNYNLKQKVNEIRQQNEREKDKNKKMLTNYIEWAKTMIEAECEEAVDQLQDTNENHPLYIYDKETPFSFSIPFRSSLYTEIDENVLNQLVNFTKQFCGPNVRSSKEKENIYFEVMFD